MAQLRVAAYCRVSTDRDDQANSLHSQQAYFRDYIQRQPDWSLVEIYADEGISGTSTRHRDAFHRMAAAAEAGELDLILTKEVSRFARNTVDTLEYTRYFKRLGVGVIFINDNIDTRKNEEEFRLTIMASIAQEESRKTSERVKWGQTRRMEAGVVFGNNSIYGFTVQNGALFIDPAEAEVIKKIYYKFLNEGKGTHVIARELYEEGIPPPKSATGKWSCVMIRRILRNEKYVGDLLQKKTVTVDFLTHKKVENRGQEEKIYIRDHHEPIVDRAAWDAVQAELSRRSGQQADSSKYSNRYWCSGKIHCGDCGSRFILRKTKRRSGEIYKVWICHSRSHYGNWKQDGHGVFVGCNMRTVNDKSLLTCVQFVLQQLELSRESIAEELLQDIQKLKGTSSNDQALERLRAGKKALDRKREKALDAFLSGTITEQELSTVRSLYDRELNTLEEQMRSAREDIRTIEAQRAELDRIVHEVQADLDNSEEVYREAIETVTVFREYIEIKVSCVHRVFRLWYHTSGTQQKYATTIDKWELLTQ